MDKELVAKKTELRESKKLARNALANKAGISPTYIYQLEMGLKSPTVEYLSYICDALDITLSDFFKEGDVDESIRLSARQQALLKEFIESLK